jgi:maleylacetate reductase
MEPFVYTASATRVVFGFGTKAALADEVRQLACSRAAILSTPHQRGDAESLAAQIGDMAVGVFADAVMHTPIDVTEAVVTRITELEADCVIALGGGSAVGLGKAVALNTDLPQIVLPTTYAGSEATSILGQMARRRPCAAPKFCRKSLSTTWISRCRCRYIRQRCPD